ncbi:hypothetical protein BCR44DRAFT_1171228 [Catenaria anguillulae PL171]|uniref:Uncharacterized protein n=1 Tax=Catenaria anguillulae PL171 TaxID=765915 RepID=A0A1Y2I053_9FUNG|nr:hypothetical protein BCR44DRAFT_1171228 [Catenaria anguillulae PL171]
MYSAPMHRYRCAPRAATDVPRQQSAAVVTPICPCPNNSAVRTASLATVFKASAAKYRKRGESSLCALFSTQSPSHSLSFPLITFFTTLTNAWTRPTSSAAVCRFYCCQVVSLQVVCKSSIWWVEMRDWYKANRHHCPPSTCQALSHRPATPLKSPLPFPPSATSSVLLHLP